MDREESVEDEIEMVGNEDPMQDESACISVEIGYNRKDFNEPTDHIEDYTVNFKEKYIVTHGKNINIEIFKKIPEMEKFMLIVDGRTKFFNKH